MGQRLFTRLGLDLHDGALQELAALGAELRLLKLQAAEGSPELVAARLDDALAMLASAERELRNLARSMDSTALVSRPFAELLQDETARAAANGVDVEARLSGDLDRCTPSQRIALLRVVQESLSNVARHSGAERASVVVSAGETSLLAEVVDRGNGFDYEAHARRAVSASSAWRSASASSTGRSRSTAAPAARRPSARRSRAGVRRARPRRGRG